MKTHRINREILHRKSILLYKQIKSKLFISNYPETLPVFILGYGRSGTTMLTKIFQRDERIEAYGETHPSFIENYHLNHQEFKKYLLRSKFPVLSVKPILDSYHASHLFLSYDKLKIIWIIRNYNDVIASAIKRFQFTVAYKMKDAITGTGKNWITKGIPEGTKEEIKSLGIDNLTEKDLMALVWWSVNRTIQLDQLYKQKKRFLLITYEDLVNKPYDVLKSVYSFIGLTPLKNSSKYIHTGSVGKGNDIALRYDVKRLCDDLMQYCMETAERPSLIE